MTAEVVSVQQLSKCSDEEFDKNIKEMSLKTLMESISTLQKEMAREQENFNSLNGELQTMKSRNSSQYKTISKEMVASQNRLTLLMNRSMKCFAQQNLQKGSTDVGSVQLRRRNSTKGEQPSPSKSSTNVQRSKSMYIPPQPDPDPPATRIIKAGSSAFINHSTIDSKPYTPVIANGILNARSPSSKSSTPRVKSQMQVLNVGSRPNNSVVKASNSVVRGDHSVVKGDNSAVKGDHAVVKTGNGVVKAGNGEVHSDKTQSVGSGNSTTNGEKEDFQALPSVKQLAKNFGAFQKTTDNVTPSNKPRLVKLRSTESMRIERPVSDGLMFSSMQKSDRVVNGNSEQTPTGRHVVSTVLKFDAAPRYKSTENLTSISLTPSRPRTNSIPRSITVSSSTRETTPANDYQDIPLSNTRVTLRSSREALNSVENQPKQSINLKPSQNVTVVNNSTKTNKIEYNTFPGKNALMQEIAARRKDSDADTTRIEVNESVLKSKPVEENPQPNAVRVTTSDNSTTRVFVSSGNKPPQTSATEAVNATSAKDGIVDTSVHWTMAAMRGQLRLDTGRDYVTAGDH